MTSGEQVAALVSRARAGDEKAWGELVERFAPLLLAVCRRFGLDQIDTLDVGQGVWLSLLEHLDSIRDPAALPGWIATTARRECLHVCTGKGGRRRRELVGEVDPSVVDLTESVDDLLVKGERHAAFLQALDDLPPQQRELLLLLMQDPPLKYIEIARRLGISVGSIGPTRARCLDKIRHHPAVAALLDKPEPAR